MDEAIEWDFGEALSHALLDDTAANKGIDERVMSDGEGELTARLLFARLHVLIDLGLKTANVAIELCIIHAVPALARIRAGTLANGNGMIELKNFVISISLCRLPLVLAGIHGPTLDSWHHVVGIVVSLMENARAWCELELSSFVIFGHWALPVIGS
jgi:hypothetical protein